MTEEAKKLVEDNHNLIYSFINKYNLSIEEHYDLAALGLCRAAMSYDSDKSAFSSYAYTAMFRYVFSEIRNQKAEKRIPENMIRHYQAERYTDKDQTVMLMNVIPAKENFADEVLSKIIIDEYMSKLKNRDRKAIILLIKGYKQQEISPIVGCEQPQISRIKRKFIKYLKECGE